MARRQPHWWGRLVLVAAASVLVAGCSSSAADQDAIAAEPRVVTTAPAARPTPAPEPTSTPVPAPTSTPSPTPTVAPTLGFTIDPDLEALLPDGWDPFVDADDQAGPTDGAPDGGALAPRGQQENRWRYTGVLGRLEPDQQVVAPVIDPPPAVDGVAPLTGLPGPSPDRPALIVKIDNVPAARPQSGLNQADILFEELVEGGMTRFAAVFHSSSPSGIGPVRSGRSTDIGIIDSFRRPIFAFSGANSIYEKLIDAQPIRNRSAEVFGGYWRSGSRPAPHNMYTDADTMLGSVNGGKAPPPHFVYRAGGQELPESARRADVVRLAYLAGSSPAIEFRWNASAGGWRRWQAGSRHTDAAGVQVTPANLVVQFVEYIDTGMTDKWGEDLYEGVSVGTGVAWVFTDGRLVEATWTRPTLRSVTTFTDADGNHVALTPGQTFVALVPPGGASWGRS